MSDWETEDTPVQAGSSNPLSVNPTYLAPPVRAPARGKFDDEDQEDEGSDDWDKSEDEKPKPKATTAAPPAKKKMSLKAKLEEKERLAKERALNGDDDDDLMPTMTEQERRRLAREREMEADLEAADELFGAASIADVSGATTPAGFDWINDKPKSKEDFAKLSKKITDQIISRHASNPLFPAFIEQLAKDLCGDLNAVQTRKVSSSLSVLGNTKQTEERDKASGKKKPAAKPKLGGAKTINKVDTDAYDDVLDDDDFM